MVCPRDLRYHDDLGRCVTQFWVGWFQYIRIFDSRSQRHARLPNDFLVVLGGQYANDEFGSAYLEVDVSLDKVEIVLRVHLTQKGTFTLERLCSWTTVPETRT